ncbi:MAG: hypothetical protein GWN93_06250 [Deltaproteobacteria bacterium]|nr:hypothetical protein [Deltaproteobacteria bacterium]
MAYLNDEVLDSGLDWLAANGARLDICSQEPTTYGEATTDAAYSLGYKTSPSIASPTDRAAGGRECVVSAIADGVVTETDTATHWAITDGVSVLIATQQLSSPQNVTDGNAFTLNEFAIGIPDPA